MTTAPIAISIESEGSVWGLGLQPAGCDVCARGFLVPAERVGQRCPACGRGTLGPQPALMRPEPPELVVAFRKRPEDLPDLLRPFVNAVWLRPDDLAVEKLAQRAVPVLWPMWLVDGKVVGAWEAELGFDYQVESARESLAGGQWRSEKMLETRIRWEPRAGQLARAYDNVATPALSDHERWLRLGGSYPDTEAQAASAESLHGALLVIPEVLPEAAWSLAKAQLDERAASDCQAAAGAQHVRRIGLRADYRDTRWTQLLLPAYLTTYTDDEGRVHPVLVNGATGRIGGRRFASQSKGLRLAGLVGLGAVLALMVGLVLLAIGALLPPVALLGGLILVAALGLGLAALWPALWPWQWNRGQPRSE
ncbi:MAG: hypothetical protein JNL73_21875 [Anaerolineales bacterium]|nr:hypothetical protein [Anaerolineales bacterium]